MWGGHSFGYWMWNVAFDGIGSTLLATGVAVVFVLRQLGHDRELVWEQTFSADCRAMAERSRTLGEAPMHGRWLRGEDLTGLLQWSTDLLNLAERVAVREPCLHALLHAARSNVIVALADIAGYHEGELSPTYTGAINKISGALTNTQEVLTARVNRPKVATKMTRERCDKLVADIHQGNIVTL